jgi:hypothetical protein
MLDLICCSNGACILMSACVRGSYLSFLYAGHCTFHRSFPLGCFQVLLDC